MKRTSSLLFVTFIVLAFVALVGCGGGATPQAPGAKPTPTKTVQQPAAGGVWKDIPLYAGAREAKQSNLPLPGAGDFATWEWRYYETNDNMDKVVSFYKSQMPARGWQVKEDWTDLTQVQFGIYGKNGDNDAATVWVASQEGKTMVALMRSNK